MIHSSAEGRRPRSSSSAERYSGVRRSACRSSSSRRPTTASHEERARGRRRQRRHLREPPPAQRLPGDGGDGQSILEHGRSLESDDDCMPIKEVLRLIPGGSVISTRPTSTRRCASTASRSSPACRTRCSRISAPTSTTTCRPEHHVINANEGGAVALAAGHHLATGDAGRLPPELRHRQRGQPAALARRPRGLRDPDAARDRLARRARRQGRAAAREAGQGHPGAARRARGPDYDVLPDDAEGAAACVDRAVSTACALAGPYALSFAREPSPPTSASGNSTAYALDARRAEAGARARSRPSDVVVATTGMTSRSSSSFGAAGEAHRPRLPHRRLDGPRLADRARGRARPAGPPGRLPRRRRRRADAHGRARDDRQPRAARTSSRRAQQRRARFRRRTADGGVRDRSDGDCGACGYRAAWWTRVPGVWRRSRPAPPDGPALLEIRVNKGARAISDARRRPPRRIKRELMETERMTGGFFGSRRSSRPSSRSDRLDASRVFLVTGGARLRRPAPRPRSSRLWRVYLSIAAGSGENPNSKTSRAASGALSDPSTVVAVGGGSVRTWRN